MTCNIPVLLGTTRIGRKSEHMAHYLLERLRTLESVSTELIDLATYDLPVFEERLSEMEDPPAGLLRFSEELSKADAVLMVVPEYKNGCPGVLKNAFDFLKPGMFHHKPIGICTVSSGGFGGINCLTQLRLLVLAMGGIPIPAKLPVSRINEVFNPEGKLMDGSYNKKADAFTDELLWYTKALKEAGKAS